MEMASASLGLAFDNSALNRRFREFDNIEDCCAYTGVSEVRIGVEFHVNGIF